MCPELSAGVFIRTFVDSRYPQDPLPEAESLPEPEETGLYNKPSQSNNTTTGAPVANQGDDDDQNEENEHGYYHVKSTRGTERLIGHIIATKTPAQAVTDESMEIPSLDEYNRLKDPKSDLRGHHEDGSTVAIHSIVVDPEFRGRSIGSIMLKDYIQRMTTLHIADRFALLAHDRLVPFYNQHEFVSQGPSKVSFSGGGWYSLIRPISDSDDMDE